MNKKILYSLLVLTGGLAAAFFIATSEPEVIPEPYTRTPPTVRVLQVEAGEEYLSISSQGTVQPRSQTELIPEVSGRVTWTSPSMVSGGAFHAGDVLLRIDDADYLTLKERMEASVQRAEVEYDHAQDELRRLSSLNKQQLASRQQLDDARRNARVAEATRTEARANLNQALRDLQRTALTAPFDGFVRNEHVDLGQFITRGQSIGTLYASDYMEVRLPISSDQLRYLGLPISTRGIIDEALRPPVTVVADYGDTTLLWEGQLARLEAVIDERSRLVYGVAQLHLEELDENRPFLPVGAFVQAVIRGSKAENTIRLPRSAMRDNNQVLVVDEDNRLQFRQITLLRLEHDDILVSDGLNDGERVCISPLQTVVEGMSVRPVLE